MATEKLKLTFIGPAATGKTELIKQFKNKTQQFKNKTQQFNNKTFVPKYENTIVLEVSKMEFLGKNNKVSFDVLDTTGQGNLLPSSSYIRYSDAIAIVLATTDSAGETLTRKTLKADAEKFYNLAKTQAPGNCYIHFVVNKTDLFVPLPEDDFKGVLEEVAKIPVSFCSAKTGAGVEEAFNQILADGLGFKPKTEPTELTDEKPLLLLSSKSSSSVGKFVADHEKLLLGNIVLIAAAIIALPLLAASPIGFLTVLAGLSVLTVAGITAGVALLFWNVGGIIGNWLFKHDEPPSDEHLSIVWPKRGGSPAPQQLPGGPPHSSVYSSDFEETKGKNPDEQLPPPNLK